MYVIRGKRGSVGDEGIDRHPIRQIGDHAADRYAGSNNSGATLADGRIDVNVLLPIHMLDPLN